MNHYDAIVIGVGSMGASACWFLSERGLKVLGLEQFDIVHEKGSHTGQSRIIRKAYFEHPDYVPLLERAYQHWDSFSHKTRSRIYERTGILYIGKPENENIKGILRSASLYKVPVEEIPTAQSMNPGSRIKEQGSRNQFKQFPEFKIPADFKAIVEPDAGFVTPERAIHLYAEEARKNGAVLKTNEAVKEWKEEGSRMKVTTGNTSYTCDKLIITAGSWSSKMLPRLSTRLKVTTQILAWVQPRHPERFALGNFPCWFIEDPEKGTYYGFPILPEKDFGGPTGFKLARHYPGTVTNADHADRTIPEDFQSEIHQVLQKYIPGADGPLVATKTCLYTYSEDEHFIIDHLPGYSKRVTIACGFSGHGFKFVPVVGEILADLAIKGKTDLPMDFLRLSRFSK
jgi:sarcosine oxidase